jgi:hypothetical protein
MALQDAKLKRENLSRIWHVFGTWQNKCWQQRVVSLHRLKNKKKIGKHEVHHA